jgi:molybdate transport system ATP-binding protein|tara:strand:+ start:9848 stop:10873 length:1026 start_codon:yes stop_codon:yes gene_type:complete
VSAVHLAGTTRAGDLMLDVELNIEPGETVALLGPNGAGKTSLLRALTGLLPLTGGRLDLSGSTTDVPGEGVFIESHRRSIGWVPQDCLLFPHLTVKQNVGFSPRATPERVEQLLEVLGITELADRKPDACSGGQAQRVALARAVAADPKVLLLDEPTAALDIDSRHLIDSLIEDRGDRATLLVTHDPVEAATTADRIVILENGHVTHAGSPVEVRTRPRTRYAASLAGLNTIAAAANGRTATTTDGTIVVLGEPATGPVHLVVPPVAVALHRTAPDGSPRNVWEATVTELQPAFDRVRVVLDGPLPIVAEVTPAAVEVLGLVPGASVWAAVKATEITVHPA